MDLDQNIDELEIKLLLEALFHKYGYDFRDYSMTSMKRRLGRACENFSCDSLSKLQDLVLHDQTCLNQLLSYMTVQVSEMFRDPAYYREIREKIVPHLKTYPSLKVWIAGCSTGEELYSLAILFREAELEERTIFYATDINPDALEKAEAGVYALDRMQEFTRNYQASGGAGSLSDYYTAAYNRAVFDKSLKRNVVFSDHSLVSDSVFAEVQFISCRNVMIYFNNNLQDRAIGLFREALCQGGFLGLGSKESLRFSIHAGAFRPVDIKMRLYQKQEEN